MSNDNNNYIKFTPYQFIGVVVMFLGLIATAIGPYIAVKTDIHNINMKISQLEIKLTSFLIDDKDNREQFKKDIEQLKVEYSKLDKTIHDFILIDSLKSKK